MNTRSRDKSSDLQPSIPKIVTFREIERAFNHKQEQDDSGLKEIIEFWDHLGVNWTIREGLIMAFYINKYVPDDIIC